MTTQAQCTFEIKSWDEKPFNEIEGGGKLTRASVTTAIHGDLKAETQIEYLMAYRLDGSANFVGLERVTGSLGGRSGSFVLQHSGAFEDGVAKSAWFVVPGSGTDELRGLRGQGGYAAGHAPQHPMNFDYDFE